MTTYKALGNYLKISRIEADLTQNEVSLALGYDTPQFVSNWERNLSYPPLKALVTISELFEIDLNDLYARFKNATLEKVELNLDAEFARSKKNPLKPFIKVKPKSRTVVA